MSVFVFLFRSVCTVKTQNWPPSRRTCQTWTWASLVRSWAKRTWTPRANQSLNQTPEHFVHQQGDTLDQPWTLTMHTHIHRHCGCKTQQLPIASHKTHTHQLKQNPLLLLWWLWGCRCCVCVCLRMCVLGAGLLLRHSSYYAHTGGASALWRSLSAFLSKTHKLS